MEKQRQKAEEQKVKQEEKERKAEEQRLKQEEKEKKAEEKRRQEEAEAAKAQKAKAAFSSFFVKKSPEEKAKVAAAAAGEERQDSKFSQFIVKKNMRLTPASRDAIQCCREVGMRKNIVFYLPNLLYILNNLEKSKELNLTSLEKRSKLLARNITSLKRNNPEPTSGWRGGSLWRGRWERTAPPAGIST